MKKIVCWGGDNRMQMLARLLKDAGHEAVWIQGQRRPDLDGVEEIIFPVPTLVAGSNCLTGSQGTVTQEQLLSELPESMGVTAYLSRERQAAWSSARPDLLLRFMNEDERFLLDNGCISAEGAIVLASSRGECLFNKRCLVLGYGHMGRALCKMLKGMGARVSVAGRSGGSLQQAFFEGLDAWDFQGWKHVLPRADWVFNTIPHPVMGTDELGLLKSGCRIMELASAPYGVDRAQAEAMRLDYRIEPSIPGRLYPLSAAKAMMASWLRYQRACEEGQHES